MFAVWGPAPAAPSRVTVASVSATQTGVGLRSCPWMIEARAGQKINLTMFSFSSTRVQAACPWTIVVKERNATVELAACSTGLGRRDRLIYSSQSHRINFHLRVNSGYRTAVTDVRIIIKYRGIYTRFFYRCSGKAFFEVQSQSKYKTYKA